MVNNPYSVLGVPENASDEEVKRAYRELSRKYHPDSYVDNPLKDLAEDKFKEVQEAYDMIMKQRSNGGYQSYGSTSGSGYGSSDLKYQKVYDYINFRQYSNAMSELNRIPLPDRDGRWYYLSAITNAGMGNNIQAQNDINKAMSIEPSNPEYRNFATQLQMNTRRYQNSPYTRGSGNGDGCGTGNFCCDLWIADSCCECMGGDLCSCI
jgi:molecular chaperone DnaJ